MTKNPILKAMALCSLCCYTGPAMKSGIIAEWKKGDERIREIGLEKFYDEITSRSHYLPFKK